jgi:hypothetical protein
VRPHDCARWSAAAVPSDSYRPRSRSKGDYPIVVGFRLCQFSQEALDRGAIEQERGLVGSQRQCAIVGRQRARLIVGAAIEGADQVPKYRIRIGASGGSRRALTRAQQILHRQRHLAAGYPARGELGMPRRELLAGLCGAPPVACLHEPQHLLLKCGDW